jgi:hypothetical protein
MLSPALSASNKSSNTITSTISVPRSANLTITMTFLEEARSKKRTKYRPVERQDGVIVLQRQYQPSSLPPQQPLKFEKHLPIFTGPTSTSKPKTAVTPHDMENDLMLIGAHFHEHGRNEDNDLTDTGRGGYNDQCDGLAAILNFVKGCSKIGETSRQWPMQRFLGEQGPWSSLEMHEN